MPQLPLFVWPQKEETLTSWLFRNGESHRLKYVTFLFLLSNNRSYYFRDLDSYINNDFRLTILDHFPINSADLDLMLLSSYKGLVFENDITRSKIVSQMICLLGSKYERSSRHSLTFCPYCLNKEKYFKKTWRLTLMVGCPIHNTYLTDRCYRCKAPINYMRLGVSSNNLLTHDISTCWNCNQNISKARPKKMPDHLIEFHQNLESTISAFRPPYSSDPLLYFQGLDAISRMISSGFPQKKRFVLEGCKLFGISTNELLSLKPEGICHKPLAERIQIVDLIARILENYPSNFDKLVKSSKTFKSLLIRNSKTPDPYWISERFYRM